MSEKKPIKRYVLINRCGFPDRVARTKEEAWEIIEPNDDLILFKEVLDEPNESDAQRFMRQCVKLTEELERVKAELAEKDKVLGFYADHTSYETMINGYCPITEEDTDMSGKYGVKAREVRKKWENKE